jgi:transposase
MGRRVSVPKFVRARPPLDASESRKIRGLAGARHAPADWIERAQIIALSWDGLAVPAIAARIGCHENTVRRWLHRFNAAGLDGLGDRPGAGRKRRITEAQRSAIIAMARSVPPGQLVRDGAGELSADDERGPAQWTLDTLAQAARDAGIAVGRSQVRRILLAEKVLGGEHRPGVRPKRTRIVELYTTPPPGSTVICADELGPVIPRTFPPAPGWSGDGHRIKAPLEYSRGPEKTWVYGGLRVADGQEVTMCAPSRNSSHYQRFLQQVEDANPHSQVVIITDNLSSHNSKDTRAWLEGHPRISHAFIPKGACWLNLQEGWWRIFRKTVLAGQSFADPDEIAHATQVATAQLNARARPWIWGRPQPKPRPYHRRFIYML